MPFLRANPVTPPALTAARRRQIGRAAAAILRSLGAALVALALVPVAATGGTIALGTAEPHVNLAPYVDVLEDRSGAWSLAEVSEGAPSAMFKPWTGVEDVNFAYSHSAYWLRFTVSADAQTERIVELAFPTLDHVAFFAGVAANPVIVGDLEPFEQRPIPNRNFLFPIALQAGETATFYLRVRSEGSLTLPLDLWTPQAFHQQDERAYFILALYFGMLLALALYNLLLYFSLREPSYLAYVLFAGAMALAQLSQNGLGNEFIWPQWTAWGNVALPCGYAATGFFGALFTRLFLDTARWSRWLDRMIVAHMTVFAIAAVSPAFAPYQAAAILTSLTGVSFAFVAVAGGVFCLRRGHPGARYFLWAWTLLLIGVAVMGLRNLGWVPTTLGSTHAIQIGSSLEMLLLSFALASRIHNERRDRERAQAEALLAAQRLERELEHKVGRRTEQLLAANARLGEAMVELAEIAATDRLTGAWNRRRLEEVATGEIERARRHGDALSLIMFDVDHFKGINDRSGHAVGDAVLEDLVAVVRTNVRASDSITRWGGEEFVVLTPATDLTGATRLAEKLRRCIAVHTFTKSHKVTVSLGVSTLLPDDDSLAQLIARADEALYRAKGEGRNRTITATEFEARRREAVVAR